ncbi:hypothetical protein GCM10009733_087490 [Nonomuraea maheshkhaliensis]|uniref:Uncharacterized protein n=1 Tax=Nonomuraea maheshkhaliensis TaxID=419590 RepID=A0ABP4SW24_9ACTN
MWSIAYDQTDGLMKLTTDTQVFVDGVTQGDGPSKQERLSGFERRPGRPITQRPRANRSTRNTRPWQGTRRAAAEREPPDRPAPATYG